MDYHFTASVEKEFDEIAQGLKSWSAVIRNFYHPFHAKIEDTMKTSEKHSGERLLGTDPVSGRNVYVKIGRFGPMAQLGDNDDTDKPGFAGLRKDQSIDTISLEEALELFKLPRTVGTYEDKTMVAAIGRFGPYIRHDGQFVSIPKDQDPLTISTAEAITLIEAKRQKDREKTIQVFAENPDIKVLKGRWGAYIEAHGENYKLPKGTDPAALTLAECEKIIREGTSTKKTRTTKKTSAPKRTKKK